MNKILIILINCLILVACGKDAQIQDKAVEVSTQDAVIIGKIDWFSSSSADLAQKNAAAPVGMLDIPSIGSRCTAFLITSNIIMTNNHCISNQGEADDAEITFNYTSRRSKKLRYRCDEFLHTNKKLDYTLIRCEENPGRKVGRVVFSSKKQLDKGQRILVTHYNCDYYNNPYCYPFLKFSKGKVTNFDARRSKVFYNADTLGGSSGSPVFYKNPKNNKYYLVALHNLGYGDRNENGRGIVNSGVFADDILKDVLAWHKKR